MNSDILLGDFRAAKARRSRIGLAAIVALVGFVSAGELAGLRGVTVSHASASPLAPVAEIQAQQMQYPIDHTAADRLLGQLEKAYWACDLEAAESEQAERRMDEGMMQVCGGISRELQRVKFDDDFGKLYQWTLENREPGNALPPTISSGSNRTAEP